ncbi:MAG: family 16 glycoside hydrolase [Balneolaceae bacterium]|nr:family 16 glycoside hydrolase [Balneolaceae bacterium]
MFNGQNLEGWTQLNGEAEYRAEDGAIVGRAVPDTPNSFLTTDKEYGDFILEFEVFMNTQMNTGVQIRSLSSPSYRDGRVHGYQVELDPSERAWSGGIYDEARRGWLYPLASNPKARSALILGQWNTVRIEAIGSTINTWINGVQCARLVDDMTGKGFIGLQVHSINDEQLVGAEVKWRNLRIRTENLQEYRRTPDPQVRQISYLKNELTSWEKSHGWRLLWDGQTSEGWRGANLDHFPQSGWTMEEGVLTIPAIRWR